LRFPTPKTALLLASLACGAAFAGPQLALAQAQVAFGGLQLDSSLPVEVTADNLAVSQADGTAVFTGNVLVGQGEMRMTAGKIQVEYAQGGSNDIRRMVATGGVTFANGLEAAEANEAIYTLESGQVVMTGDVILTQGPNAISGNRLTVNLDDGTGQMEGRVKTILQTGNR